MADHYISWNKGDAISPANITAGKTRTGAMWTAERPGML